jgi:hypothetical protein
MLPNRYSSSCEVLPLFVLVALVVWFGGEMIWDAKIPFLRDLGPYFYPMRWSLAESLRSGQLPLWDRHMAAGFPLLADFQSAVFYPPHLALLFLPFFSAISVLFMFHYFVAASGSYLLCRHWGYPPYLSMIGAILFTFGGVMVSLVNLLNHFQAAVWLPWVVLFAEKCFRLCCWRNFCIWTFVLLLQFLAGSPEFYLMSMALVVLASWRLKATRAESETYGKIALVLLGGNALVIALAMIQIAPTIELFLHSRRSQPIPFSEATDWSLNPYNLLNLFFLDKEVDTTILAGVRLFFLSRASFLVSYYLGAASLFGVWFWIVYSSRKERAVTLALLLLTLVFAFGAYTPVYPLLLHAVPVLGVVRFPEKFFFMTYGLLWFVALRGFSIFFDAEAHQPKRFFAVLFSLLFTLTAFYLVLTFNPGFVSQFVSFRTNSPILSYPTLKVAAAVLVSVERQLFLSVGLAVLFFAIKKRLARIALLQVLLVIVVFVDLERAHRGYQYLLDPSFIYKGPRVISQPEADFGRVFYYPAGETLHPAQYSVLARPSFEEAIALVFGNLLPNTGIFHGFDYFQEIDAFSRRPYLVFLRVADRLEPEKRIRVLGALNVKYLVSLRPLAENGISLVRHFPAYPSWLYKIDRTVPRVYIVGRSTVEKDPKRVIQRLASAEFDPTQEVLLDEDLGIQQRGRLIATADLIRYDNSSVSIKASLSDSGILIVADSFYQGWKAYVNGKEEVIRSANLFFRAVPLPPGNHTVEFRYEPRSFTIGFAVTSIALLSVLVISGFCIRGKAPKHHWPGLLTSNTATSGTPATPSDK